MIKAKNETCNCTLEALQNVQGKSYNYNLNPILQLPFESKLLILVPMSIAQPFLMTEDKIQIPFDYFSFTILILPKIIKEPLKDLDIILQSPLKSP